MLSFMRKILLIGISLLLNHCGANTADEEDDPVREENQTTLPSIIRQDQATREKSHSLYQAVGEIYNGSNGYCSGLIVAPGVFLTARHCFPHQTSASLPLQRVSLKFPADGFVDQKSQEITGEAIENVILDEGDNDLAFVLFDRSVLEFIVPMDSIRFARIPAAPDTPLHIVGFPSTADGIRKRIISHSCRTSARSGRIDPLPNDPGYGGILYDSNCLAWFGNSGGPVFQVDENEQAIALLGVVSHTFDITAEGDIDASKVARDSYGRYVSSVNYSPIGAYLDWDSLLSEVPRE